MTAGLTVPLADLRRQYAAIRQDIDRAIAAVLERGDVILGEDCEALEREFAAYSGVPFAVGVACGTDALLIALRACGVGRNDEVLLPPNACISCSSAIVHAGAVPVFVDVDPASLQIAPKHVERHITARTRAILAVHLFGQPADVEALSEIARRRGLQLIEDAALAVGAEVHGTRVGSFGDAAVFSFHPMKMLGAFGDAGMVVTAAPEIADRVRRLARYGGATTGPTAPRTGFGPQEVLYTEDGYNSRIDTLQAAVLRVKLRHLDQALQRRTDVANRYQAALDGVPIDLPRPVGPVKRQYPWYMIGLDQRDRAAAFLNAGGVAVRVPYYPLLPFQPVYRHLGYRRGDFPAAERFADRMVALPCDPELTDEQVDVVASLVRQFVMGAG